MSIFRPSTCPRFRLPVKRRDEDQAVEPISPAAVRISFIEATHFCRSASSWLMSAPEAGADGAHL